MPLSTFHPLVRDWFLERFGASTQAQALGWRGVAQEALYLLRFEFCLTQSYWGQRVLAAYQEVIRLGYRFYSFGDTMLIV